MGELPHVCPYCGERFGWGEDVALLAVVSSCPFDEPSPCCGERVSGVVHRDGSVDFVNPGSA